MLFDYKDQLKTGECCLHMWSSFPGMSGDRATVLFCVFSLHHNDRRCPALCTAVHEVVGGAIIVQTSRPSTITVLYCDGSYSPAKTKALFCLALHV